MITILQLCEHFGGRNASLHGVARTFQWWIPAFDQSRFRVLLCSRKGPDKGAAQMRAVGIEPLFLGYGKMDPRNLSALLRLMRRERVDIIHAHGFGACTWGRLAGYILHRPVIVHERCNYTTVPAYQRPVEWLLGPRTKYALAVSESTKLFCVQQRHIPPNAIQVLYHGIMMDDITPAAPDWIAARRVEYGAAPATKIIGIVGRLEPHKGHADAMRALASLRRDDWQLWIIGDGGHMLALQQLATELKISDRVVFTGFRPDARQMIQAFDIQLFPSHMEGTPNTLYEALAAGNAIVASTADGQGEVLKDGECALLFPPGNLAAMAAHLTRIMDDTELHSRLRARARARAPDFDGHRTIELLQTLYETIMRTNA